MLRRCGWAVAWMVFLMASATYALEVEQVIWGFDGTVVVGEFNPMSVLVSNPAPEPFEGFLTLNKQSFSGARLGARLVEPCYLAPGSSRWVQFYPYMTNSHDEWRVSWGMGPRQSMAVEHLRMDEPASVVLVSQDTLAIQRHRLKRFPEHLFPATVAGTAGLRAVALDHMPRWEQARRVAFMEWLRSGGVVHLFWENPNQFPRFDSELSPLNAPLEELRLGTGRVYRHPRVMAGVTSLEALTPKPEKVEAAADDDETMAETTYMRSESLDPLYTRQLTDLVQPDHSWGMIYLMSIAYILLVGPLLWIGSRRRWGYRVVMGLTLLFVFLFGQGFFAVGRRGYGEVSSLHTLSYARPVGDNAWSVLQYANAFVTSSDEYQIVHAGTSNLYSTAQEYEAVNGVIRNGAGGMLAVEMPLYSNRSFIYRGRIEAPSLEMDVQKWQLSKNRFDLQLRAEQNWPGEVLDAWVVHQNRFYDTTINGRTVTVSEKGDRLKSSLHLESLRQSGRWAHMVDEGGVYAAGPWRERSHVSLSRVAERLAKPMIAERLGLLRQSSESVTGDDEIHLFLLAVSPEAFRNQSSGLGKEDGYVLYHLSITRPSTLETIDG